ncbi:polymerase delta-interacting protein 3 S6K1 [Takifugu flavidus]|uniref:Polymerase delta-interacting protein 3 S6K1 n=1 Tax=Takifugu flavidus TaxID=433684 RepID=A0A5C6NQW7_9TELE|nr:polymerase delta-interacting protein 3 S6K1 [Takifugu flavidus]
MAKNFDARQKIGVNDVRQRLGGGAGFQVKDAREKLGQKDARFKIRGRGAAAAGGVQDARQMINSRKQVQSQLSTPTQSTVAHHQQGQHLVPQIQIHNNNLLGVNIRKFTPNVQGLGARGAATVQPGNNRRMIDARDRLSLKRSISGIQAQTSATPPLKITKTIQQRPVGMTGGIRAATQPVLDDHDGISNKQLKVATARSMLQSRELFCVCGALKRARLVRVGVAEVVFVRKEDAVSAYRKYNNRCLDGQPMKCNLHIQGSVITSDQPILLRLSDTPGASNGTKKDGLPSSSRPSGQRASSQPTPEVDPQTILKALFKSTAQPTSSTEPPSSQATAFRIKI